LDEALAALARDSQFLLRDEVFTPEVLATWASAKRREAEAVRTWPHPWEYGQYFDG
jgi:glutamine synthetase